jgi:hypothetical protein
VSVLIHRKDVLENDLEIILPRAAALLDHELGDSLVSVGFCNSIHHPSKLVLGIRIKALAIHDWDLLKTLLQDELSSMIVVMFIPVTPAHSRQTKYSGCTWSHKTFPPPLDIGMSISAMGADRSGSFGAFFRLVSPEGTSDTAAFLTSSYAIVADIESSTNAITSQESSQGYSRGNAQTLIAIQCPSRKDLALLMADAESSIDVVDTQIKCLQEKTDLDITEKEELVERSNQFGEIKRKRQDYQAALDCQGNATAGHVLHASTPGSRGTRGSKMDWALIAQTQNRTKVKEQRPEMSSAPSSDPRGVGYKYNLSRWRLEKLQFNQWICIHGATSGVREDYTNGMRTYVNGCYEIKGLAADLRDPKELVDVPLNIMYAGRLMSLSLPGDSGSAVWSEEGNMVGLLWGDTEAGAFMTSMDEVVTDIRNKTGLDLEPS